MNMKPWREIAIPHEDVHKGTYLQAEFAADITQVHTGKATAEYADPVLFFQRTYITEGMGQLLTSVARRLSGSGGDPVIQLQTAFGGGKTHTMLAVMHMVSGRAARSDLAGIPALLDRAGVMDLPKARVVVLDGIRLSPSQPRQVDGHRIHTLWGEVAWQLGGAEAYARVAKADETGTSPGKEVLADLLNAYSPCVVLIDEAVAYMRQFEEGKSLTGGTFDSNITFVQALTEAMKAAPQAVLLGSLPESEAEVGGQRGRAALAALEKYFGRLQAIWKPVSSDEAFEIVRRRLFTEVQDQQARDDVCRAFADHYVKHADEVPGEVQEGRYYDRMRAAYPIHPEVFDRLYEDWSVLPSFQRTRGVLKLMARVIHRLWQDGNTDLLLMPGSLPLHDRDVHTELTNYLSPGWDPVIERDVDGPRSEPAELEQREARFGAVHACRRVTRSIFLGSAPAGANAGARGLETERVMLACLQPGQPPHVYKDALNRLENRLTYLNKGADRWWFDIRPNLRREMEERKRRFSDHDVTEEIRSALGRVMGSSQTVDAIHYFTPSGDVPDEWSLRLVVLPPSQAWTRSGPNAAREAANDILRTRGDQPRQKQNRVLFLAAEADQVMHLRDTVRALLAWRSIENDAKELRLTLDNQQQKQATQWREQTAETVLRLVREAYRWVIVPLQSARPGQGVGDVEWEAYPLNPASAGLAKEFDRVLLENEAVIQEWAPLHLHNLLKAWFWKSDVPDVATQEVWQKMASYLYFPRLTKSSVLQTTITHGASSRDFFGIASAANGDEYQGFSIGRAAAVYMDALRLIEPGHAAAYEARKAEEAAEPPGTPPPPGTPNPPAGPTRTGGTTAPAQPPSGTPAKLTRYFGTAELDPVRAALAFSTLAQEIIELFTSSPNAKVRIKVDIEAEDPSGFSEATVRAVRENSKHLNVRPSEFD